MSDVVTTARTARESLARALNALQTDPNVPRQLLELAAPIAQAMGALHAIERSSGRDLSPHAEVALNHTRTALGQLQAQPPNIPAVSHAMEAVAGSLGAVHALSKMAAATAPAPAIQAAPAARPAPAAAPAPQPQAYPAQPPARAQPVAAVDPFASARTVAAPMPAAAPAAAPPASAGLGPAGSLQVVTADLGTQSPTNFFKGLSGNDIIEHGGLFVSTYMIPPLGTKIRLKISLPGGYEFEANAVVKWAREQSDDGAAPPGFGAQFTQITPEARQLVYRYTRNREPLFHDDL